MVEETMSERLRRLLETILSEERAFQDRSIDMQTDQHSLDELHARMADRINLCGDHGRIRAAHEAMFKVHRKIFSEHQRVVEHCHLVLSRLRLGALSESEMAHQVESLESLLERVRREHTQMEQERQSILTQHRDFVQRFVAPST